MICESDVNAGSDAVTHLLLALAVSISWAALSSSPLAGDGQLRLYTAEWMTSGTGAPGLKW
jgi:hypothetical protein